MRGSVVAACAALLVGISPAGALPFASFAAAAVSRIEIACGLAERPLRPSRRDEARRASRETVLAGTGDTTRIPAAFRSPSGPAPSQAPPAA